MDIRPCKNLILVPGHGVCQQGCTSPEAACQDKSWIGIFPGEGPFYVEHIQKGVQLAHEDPQAMLVFSGGQTREAAGPRSEAQGYWEIAQDAQWWQMPEVKQRACQEEYARDSFENLLYGLAVFYEKTRDWPEMVTVCGWLFKEKRYSLHRQALKWPAEKFRYMGVNDPLPGEALAKAIAGEKNKIDSVSQDIFLMGSPWVSQRELRNPFHRQHPYRNTAPALTDLFDFLDKNTYTRKIPWI